MARVSPEALQSRRNLVETLKRVVRHQTELGVTQEVILGRLGRVGILAGYAPAGRLHLSAPVSLVLIDRILPTGDWRTSVTTRGIAPESVDVAIDPFEPNRFNLNGNPDSVHQDGEWIRRLVACEYSAEESRLVALQFNQRPFGISEQEIQKYVPRPGQHGLGIE